MILPRLAPLLLVLPLLASPAPLLAHDETLADAAGDLLEEARALADAARPLDGRDRLRDLGDRIRRVSRLSSPAGRTRLLEAERRLADAAYLLDEGVIPRREEYRETARLVLDAVSFHHRERAREFRRHGYRREGERHDGLARRAADRGLDWSDPVKDPSAGKAAEQGFVSLARNLVKAIDNGFRDTGSALDRSLDLSRSLKRREEKAQRGRR